MAKEHERALIELGTWLISQDYKFTTPTPATHASVLRRVDASSSLRDIFGWSRGFRATDLPANVLSMLIVAGECAGHGDTLFSRVRFSTLEDQLFVHSAFPTLDNDAVFFGPDTYRFARALAQMVDVAQNAPSIVDVGCGSGAGGLFLARKLAGKGAKITLVDINPKALRYSRVNAALNGVTNTNVVESDLFANVTELADLIISNPPYLVDHRGRAYRHGGECGFEISLRIVEESFDRLRPGGRLLLYTGAPVIDGIDQFRSALQSRLPRNLRYAYEEIDPDVFGEELERRPYRRVERIAVVVLTIDL